MVASFCRNVGEAFDSFLTLESQSRSVCVYPRLELAAIGEMKSVQEPPLIVADRRCPLTGAHRLLEFPYVNSHQFWMEPELSCCREYEIASKRMSGRVVRPVDGVPWLPGRGLRPGTRLDAGAR